MALDAVASDAASARPSQSVRDVAIWLSIVVVSLVDVVCVGLNDEDTFSKIAVLRKCRLALESIAPRYALVAVSGMSKHVSDVGGERRVGVDILPDLAGGDAKAHRQPKDVHEFLAGVAHEMRAENAIGRLVDDDLRHATVSAYVRA